MMKIGRPPARPRTPAGARRPGRSPCARTPRSWTPSIPSPRRAGERVDHERGITKPPVTRGTYVKSATSSRPGPGGRKSRLTRSGCRGCASSGTVVRTFAGPGCGRASHLPASAARSCTGPPRCPGGPASPDLHRPVQRLRPAPSPRIRLEHRPQQPAQPRVLLRPRRRRPPPPRMIGPRRDRDPCADSARQHGTPRTGSLPRR